MISVLKTIRFFSRSKSYCRKFTHRTDDFPNYLRVRWNDLYKRIDLIEYDFVELLLYWAIASAAQYINMRSFDSAILRFSFPFTFEYLAFVFLIFLACFHSPSIKAFTIYTRNVSWIHSQTFYFISLHFISNMKKFARMRVRLLLSLSLVYGHCWWIRRFCMSFALVHAHRISSRLYCFSIQKLHWDGYRIANSTIQQQ